MPERLHYGMTAKVLHWSIVTLLIVQYLVGWLMPDVHGGPPGIPMT
jgi:cytochrome b561